MTEFCGLCAAFSHEMPGIFLCHTAQHNLLSCNSQATSAQGPCHFSFPKSNYMK